MSNNSIYYKRLMLAFVGAMACGVYYNIMQSFTSMDILARNIKPYEKYFKPFIPMNHIDGKINQAKSITPVVDLDANGHYASKAKQNENLNHGESHRSSMNQRKPKKPINILNNEIYRGKSKRPVDISDNSSNQSKIFDKNRNQLKPSSNKKKTIKPVYILDENLDKSKTINPVNISHINTKQINEISENHITNICTVEWNNPKVDLNYYEHPVHNQKAFKLEKLGKTITPIYQDPMISLDPKKFIIPILINGPNNQITGFREAVFVAIRLNRTVVIPKFYKHFSDSSVNGHRKTAIYPGHRVNIVTLCKFVSCITIEQFRIACDCKLDTFFQLRELKESEIKSWMRQLGMELEGKRGTNYNLGDVNLIPPNPPTPEQRLLKFGSDEIKKIFTTEAKCTVYPYALYNLHIRGNESMDDYNVNLVRSTKGMAVLPRTNNFHPTSKIPDIENLSDHELFALLIENSGSPEYMKKIAKQFVEKKFRNKPFVCVHWRYNKNDFMTRCQSKVVDAVKTQLCKSALRIKPVDIARSIETKIAELKETADIDVGNIYIAAPLGEREVIANVSKILYDEHGWRTRCSIDLDEYLLHYKESCDALRKHYEDILSTIEMEICILGTSFLGSAGSSWSGNVHMARRITQPSRARPESDGDIFRMATAVMNERKKKKKKKT